MDQAFAGKQSGLPKTQSLESTIARAIAVAANQSHRVVTLEHLLSALLDDAQAAATLTSCNVNIAKLRVTVDDYLTHGLATLRSPVKAEPFLSNDVEMVIANAAAAAEQTGRAEIDGAIVLAALVGGNSTAAHILISQGLSFDDAIASIREQTPQTRMGAPAAPSGGAALPPPSASPRPHGMPTAHPAPGQELTVDDLMASVKEIIGVSPGQKASPAPSAPPPAAAPHETPNSAAPPSQPELPTFGRPTQASPAPVPQRDPGPSRRSAAVARQDDETGSFDFGADARYGAAEELSIPAPQQPATQGTSTAIVPASKETRLENALQSGTLAENIPREMCEGIAVPIEVRISSADIVDLDRGMSGTAAKHSITTSEAMTVQLRAPQGGFIIESSAPETQWIGKSVSLQNQEYGAWTWTVTPTQRGRKRLQLILSARLVDDRGLMAEKAMPEQVIVVNVKINYAETFKKVAGWAAIAVAGGVLSHYGEVLFSWIGNNL